MIGSKGEKMIRDIKFNTNMPVINKREPIIEFSARPLSFSPVSVSFSIGYLFRALKECFWSP